MASKLIAYLVNPDAIKLDTEALTGAKTRYRDRGERRPAAMLSHFRIVGAGPDPRALDLALRDGRSKAGGSGTAPTKA